MIRNILRRMRGFFTLPVLALIAILLVLTIFLSFFHLIGGASLVIGRSMQPTLQPWDMLHTEPVRSDTELQVGDIVTLRHDGKTLIKRVRGVPGDTIGATEEEEAIGIPLLTLGPDEYYVVGDNYGNSNDSRAFGPVRREDILYRCVGEPIPGLVALFTVAVPFLLLIVFAGLFFMSIPRYEGRVRLSPRGRSSGGADPASGSPA